MHKITLTLTGLILLSGCSAFMQDYYDNKGRHGLWDPETLFMGNLPDGDDSYSQGFRDGCNTANGIIGSGYNRTHSFAFDVNRGLEDRDYYRGYRIGNNYCTYYNDNQPL